MTPNLEAKPDCLPDPGHKFVESFGLRMAAR